MYAQLQLISDQLVLIITSGIYYECHCQSICYVLLGLLSEYSRKHWHDQICPRVWNRLAQSHTINIRQQCRRLNTSAIQKIRAILMSSA